VETTIPIGDENGLPSLAALPFIRRAPAAASTAASKAAMSSGVCSEQTLKRMMEAPCDVDGGINRLAYKPSCSRKR
jgi:hypothetical protein